MPPSPPPPKALLFDIGGVCVLSPFQAILDYEKSNGIPPGWINFAISGSKPNGAWHRMERGELTLGPRFYAEFKKDLSNEKLWTVYCERLKAKSGAHAQRLPPVPQVDTEWLLNAILTISRNPDPHMFPALKKLKASGRFVMAALSNTMALPDGHFANAPHQHDPRLLLDPFVSSAHAGVRKPELRAYEVAFELMQKKYKEQFGKDDLQPGDVVFLDDIGENLRQAREKGFRTIKVLLGKTELAVKELETLTGLSLIDNAAKL